MNNKAFKIEIEKSEVFQKELDGRLGKSKEIIRNLYWKIFRNYDISIKDVFGWIDAKAFVSQDGCIYYWNDKTKKNEIIEPIYYSADVRRIATLARKSFYKTIRQRATDQIAQIEQDVKINKQKLDYHQMMVDSNELKKDHQRKLIAKISGKSGRKVKNLGTKYCSSL